MESQELPEPGAQFKCLLYAEPVFGDNGPFELLVNYDRKQLARMQVSDPKELGPGGRSRWHRFTDETIANVTRMVQAMAHLPSFDAAQSTVLLRQASRLLVGPTPGCATPRSACGTTA